MDFISYCSLCYNNVILILACMSIKTIHIKSLLCKGQGLMTLSREVAYVERGSGRNSPSPWGFSNLILANEYFTSIGVGGKKYKEEGLFCSLRGQFKDLELGSPIVSLFKKPAYSSCHAPKALQRWMAPQVSPLC